jgi:hypothetical protein
VISSSVMTPTSTTMKPQGPLTTLENRNDSSLTSSTTINKPTTTIGSVLDQVKSQLAKVQAWEDQLKQATSTLSAQQEAENVTHQTAEALQQILERYQQARSLYLHRRIKHVLCDHTSTFDGKTFTHPKNNNAQENNKGDHTVAHSNALAHLHAAMKALAENCTRLQEETYPSVQQERAALERMVQTLEGELDSEGSVGDDENEPPPNAVVATREDLLDGQIRLDALERRKRALPQELAATREQEKQARAQKKAYQEELEALQTNSKSENDPEHDSNLEEDQETQQDKWDSLQEIKQYYDVMQQVMEELGGIKMIDTREQESNRHLILTFELYDRYCIRIDLEPLPRRKEFRVFHAQWWSAEEKSSSGIGKARVLVYADQQSDEESGGLALADDVSNRKKTNRSPHEPISLVIPSLDDLVQIAKMTVSPGEDVQFLLREALYRVRVLQDRVNELDSMRRRVLTKVVGDSGDQVVCSFNEGILVCLRLQERHILVEQVVGVGGWDPQVLEQLQKQLQNFVSHAPPQRHGGLSAPVVTPTSLVNKIQSQLEAWKQEGTITFPKTPRMPHKQSELQGFF